MINTHAFDYITVLSKGADAAWLRNDCISNNIANADTPGYKREDVDFKAQLKRAMGTCSQESVDAKVGSLTLSDLRPMSYTDYASFSYRSDGNNVDPEVENVYLAENQLYYQGLLTAMTSEFENLQAAMK